MAKIAKQIRAARALLGWSQAQLAEKARLSYNVVQRMDAGSADSRFSTVQAVIGALEGAGIEFVNRDGYEGVLLRTPSRKRPTRLSPAMKRSEKS